MNVFHKLFSIIIGSCLLFLLPFLYFSINTDFVTDTFVEYQTKVFLDNIRECGYIDEKQYVSYLIHIGSFGNCYQIHIDHTILCYEPEYCFTSTQSKFPIFTGNVMAYSIHHYEDEIISALQTDGIYRMKQGDQISITVNKRLDTLGTRLIHTIFHKNYTKNIYYSGIVRSS